MKPRIAIPVPTSSDHPYNDLNWPAFAEAVSACGGEPIKIALHATPRELTDLAYSCQAILLPGSPADVNPAKYGQERKEGTAPADLPRENVDELLLQDAHNLYKPVLGVCFGMQMLNVWRSGTLIQDLAPLPINHSAARGVAVAHPVAVTAGSLLSQLLLPRDSSAVLERLPVNSSHHQAIGIAGDGLRVSARSVQDGVVEAIEGGQAISYPNTLRNNLLQPHTTLFLGCNGIQNEALPATQPQERSFPDLSKPPTRWAPRAIMVSVVADSVRPR